MTLPNAPPNLPLVFRVGVVGHRWNRLGPTAEDRAKDSAAALAATAAAERGFAQTVRGVLQHICEAIKAIGRDSASGYDSEAPRLAVVSALAEGADSLVAGAGLALDFELWAVLPYDEAEYRRDFDGRWQAPSWSRPGAREQFSKLLSLARSSIVMDGVPDRHDRYVSAGRVVLSQSDVLVAIWDGRPASGTGGTAELVTEARAQGVPVIRIDYQDPTRVWLEGDESTDALAAIGNRVRRLVLPPEVTDPTALVERRYRLDFFKERLRHGPLGQAHGVITGFFRQIHNPVLAVLAPTFLAWPTVLWRTLRAIVAPSAEPASFWSTIGVHAGDGGQAVAARISERLATPHEWFDSLATYYGNRYRSSFTWIFSLAWVAAVAAVIGFVARSEQWPEVGLFAGLEVLVIVAVLGLVVWGGAGRYHDRWVDYRLLAEQLRHLAFVWPLGGATAQARLPVELPANDPRTKWVGWYYRAFVRQLGLPTARFDQTHRDACLGIFRFAELGAQRDYHRRTADRYQHIYHVVHLRTVTMAVIALPVALAHLFHLPEALAQWAGREFEGLFAAALTILSVFLPSRAAALHGWAGHADFRAAAIRSAQIEGGLAELDRMVEQLPFKDSNELSRVALEAVQVMEGELGAWRTTALAKPLQPV